MIDGQLCNHQPELNMTKENKKPDPRRDNASREQTIEELEPRADEKIKGGDTAAPRDVSTGLATGRRQH